MQLPLQVLSPPLQPLKLLELKAGGFGIVAEAFGLGHGLPQRLLALQELAPLRQPVALLIPALLQGR